MTGNFLLNKNEGCWERQFLEICFAFTPSSKTKFSLKNCWHRFESIYTFKICKLLKDLTNRLTGSFSITTKLDPRGSNQILKYFSCQF